MTFRLIALAALALFIASGAASAQIQGGSLTGVIKDA